MTTNNTSALDEQFNMQCKVISLKYEYGIDSSLPQWAIISALTENEIMNLRCPYAYDGKSNAEIHAE